MPGDNFVERVHAYSKWLLGLENTIDSDSATPLRQTTPRSGGSPNMRREDSPMS
jgi:hypothetical protein